MMPVVSQNVDGNTSEMEAYVPCPSPTFRLGQLHKCLENVPSVGVKEGLSCVFSRAKWRGKAPNLALP